MLLPVMLLASGCQSAQDELVLIPPREWYEGMVSDDPEIRKEAEKSACFPDIAIPELNRIEGAKLPIEFVEELPSSSMPGGWTLKKVRLVVGGEDIFVERGATEPYLEYHDYVDRLLGLDPSRAEVQERSSKPYCFNIVVGDDSSGND